MRLLTTDWHLTDQSQDEYRWEVFEFLHSVLEDHAGEIHTIDLLGDVWDRKDRHSAAFVNRIIAAFRDLSCKVQRIHILRGNHDTPLRGPPYWRFLSYFEGRQIHYVASPEEIDGVLYLPHSPNPVEDWRVLDLPNYRAKALFLHATVRGARSESGMVLEGGAFPAFPLNTPIYSGDVHVPQETGGVTYVGAPHHVDFGDRFQPRVLLLDETCKVVESIPVPSVRKHQIVLTDLSQIEQIEVSARDQVQIKVELSSGNVRNWPAIRGSLEEWAQQRGVEIRGLSSSLSIERDATRLETLNDPREILSRFVQYEGVDPKLHLVGKALLDEVL